MFGDVPVSGQQQGGGGRKLGINDEPHGSMHKENRVVELCRRVFEAGGDIFALQIRVIFENLGLGDFGGEQIQNIFYADAHPSDARATAALVWVEGDSSIHGRKVNRAA